MPAEDDDATMETHKGNETVILTHRSGLVAFFVWPVFLNSEWVDDRNLEQRISTHTHTHTHTHNPRCSQRKVCGAGGK